MAKRAKLSVVMIARNAEKQIGRTLASVDWADEICVADTGSEDDTKGEAEKFGARTQSINFTGFGKAKQVAASMASNEWLLSLDSDEVITPELKQSILDFLQDCDSFAGAEFSRITNLCGHWIFHSGWYPEYVMRLFNRDRAGFDDRLVHESIKYNGRIKRLDGDLLHYSYPDIKTYLHKTREYAELAAIPRKKRPLLVNLFSMLLKPGLVFTKKFILQLGFLDGLPGLWIAGFSAYGQFLRYYYAIGR
jgi:(heptosyl)LPS beta-1,4-glucosyltransferase